VAGARTRHTTPRHGAHLLRSVSQGIDVVFERNCKQTAQRAQNQTVRLYSLLCAALTSNLFTKCVFCFTPLLVLLI